jgi:lysophospholipase L1-like esterase
MASSLPPFVGQSRNLIPDPFYRLAWGQNSIDGNAPQDPNGPNSSNTAIIAQSANSPFKLGYTHYLPSGSSGVAQYVDLRRMGLEVGDTLTVVWGVWANQTVQFSFWLYDANNNVLSDQTPASITLNGAYGTVKKTITITQAMLTSASAMRLSLLYGQTSTTTVYSCGRGIYKNNVNAQLIDDSWIDDDLQIRSLSNRRYREGIQHLRETRMRLTQIQQGIANQMIVAMIGDSWTQAPTRWSGYLASSLISQFGDAGGGYVSFASGGTGLANGNVRPTLYTSTLTGSWSISNYTNCITPDIGTAQSSNPGDSIAVGIPTGPVLSGANLFYQGDSAASVEYNWNGGSWTTVNLPVNSTGIGLVALTTNMPTTGAAATLNIQVVSGTCKLGGVDLQSAATGVRVHKIAATGTATNVWATESTSSRWQSGLAALNPRLVTVLFGTNDQNAILPEQFDANLRAILGNIRLGVPLADILVIAPAENMRGNSYPMARYAAKMANAAADYHAAFLDLQFCYGNYPADYGNVADFPNSRNWFTAIATDGGIHPNTATYGGLPIFTAVQRMMLDA